MAEIEHIHRRLSGKHIVWFHETNQWVAFEKPAYKVYKWLRKGKSLKKTTRRIAKKYDLGKNEAGKFVSEINKELKKLTYPSDKKSKNSSDIKIKVSSKKNTVKKDKKSCYTYLINKTYLEVDYTNEKLAYYLNASIKHLETSKKVHECNKLTLSKDEKGFCIKDALEINCYPNIAELKHAFTNKLMETAYGIKEEEWFSWIHGSAVTKGRNGAIFTSSSGSGKSTLATVLQSRKYSTLSDDMVYMNRGDNLAYPVPTALSIKSGALETVSQYLPKLNVKHLKQYEFGNRKISFMAPENYGKAFYEPKAIFCIIFIKYNPKHKFSIKEISDFEAFQRFHKEAWMNGSKKSALAFIAWFEGLSYYELEYSDTEKAMDAVEGLFHRFV